jgi:hypothetical protein
MEIVYSYKDHVEQKKQTRHVNNEWFFCSEQRNDSVINDKG